MAEAAAAVVCESARLEEVAADVDAAAADRSANKAALDVDGWDVIEDGSVDDREAVEDEDEIRDDAGRNGVEVGAMTAGCGTTGCLLLGPAREQEIKTKLVTK